MKSKLVVVAMAGMLAMCLGLVACGGSASSSAASSSAASSAASSSTAASSAAASSAAASSAASSTAASNEVVYWAGTMADGTAVTYVDETALGEGALAIVKSGATAASTWVGPYTIAEDGKVTITDDATKQEVNFYFTEVNPRTSMKMDIEGTGEVEVKAVTEAELTAAIEEWAKTDEGQKYIKKVKKAVKKAEKKLAREAKKFNEALDALDPNVAVFWDGTLADGSYVTFAEDPESQKASLSVIKKDYSDGTVWYGKYSAGQDGKTTLTDKKSGETVTYTVAETTPGSAMKISVDKVGDADLKAVTKDDVKKLVDEINKAIEEEAAAATK